MRALLLWLGVGLVLAVCWWAPASAQVRQAHCCTAIVPPPTPPPTPPPGLESSLPFKVFMGENGAPCSGGGNGLDPGPVADAALGAASGFIAETCRSLDVSGGVLAANCPGWTGDFYSGAGTGCLALQYEDLAVNGCNTAREAAFWNWAIANDENAFLHSYPNSPVAANRLTGGSIGVCSGGGTLLYNMNLGDPTADAWLGPHIYGNTTYYPQSLTIPTRSRASFGSQEDDISIGYNSVNGHNYVHSSTEFGGNTTSTGFTWLVGNGAFNVGYSVLAGFGRYFSDAGIPMAGNLLSGGASWCSTKVSTHCYGSTSFSSGVYDLQYRTDLLCSSLTNNNLKAMDAERIVVNSGGAFNPTATITTVINTVAGFVNDNKLNKCANMPIIDVDAPFFGTKLTDARWEEIALYAMVPSNDGTDDEMWPQWYVVGKTSTELSIWPDREIVASGPENAPADFVWGQVVNAASGSGCPANGDTGGAVALLVDYNASTGACIFAQQYQHCYLNKVDQGPCEFLLNPTTVTVTITDGSGGTNNFCPNDPCATYTYAAGFTGYELNNLNGIDLSLGCSNPTYCNGALNWYATPFTAGTTTLAANSGMLLHGGSPNPLTYVYTGCSAPVQIYNGTAGLPDPISGRDISNAAVDSNSNAIIGPSGSLFGSTAFKQNDNSSLERVNCATNATPTFVAQTASGGHFNGCGANGGPISVNAHESLGGCGAAVPWCSSGCLYGLPFVFEGQFPNGGCSNPPDCHWIVLNTDTGVDSEGGGNGTNSFNGTVLKVYAGSQINLRDTITNNWLPSGTTYGNNNGDSGIPRLLTIAWGDDLGASTINHPLGLITHTSMTACFTGCSWRGTNLSPGVGGDGSCSTGITGCLLYGDLLRLRSTVSCSSSDSQVVKICNALKHYGAYVLDTSTQTSSSPVIELGQSANGTDPWHTAVVTFMNARHLSDFEIISRGLTRP